MTNVEEKKGLPLGPLGVYKFFGNDIRSGKLSVYCLNSGFHLVEQVVMVYFVTVFSFRGVPIQK